MLKQVYNEKEVKDKRFQTLEEVYNDMGDTCLVAIFDDCFCVYDLPNLYYGLRLSKDPLMSSRSDEDDIKRYTEIGLLSKEESDEAIQVIKEKRQERERAHAKQEYERAQLIIKNYRHDNV